MSHRGGPLMSLRFAPALSLLLLSAALPRTASVINAFGLEHIARGQATLSTGKNLFRRPLVTQGPAKNHFPHEAGANCGPRGCPELHR